jgi:hypothetical protein
VKTDRRSKERNSIVDTIGRGLKTWFELAVQQWAEHQNVLFMQLLLICRVLIRIDKPLTDSETLNIFEKLTVWHLKSLIQIYVYAYQSSCISRGEISSKAAYSFQVLSKSVCEPVCIPTLCPFEQNSCHKNVQQGLVRCVPPCLVYLCQKLRTSIS